VVARNVEAVSQGAAGSVEAVAGAEIVIFPQRNLRRAEVLRVADSYQQDPSPFVRRISVDEHQAFRLHVAGLLDSEVSL